MKTRILCPACEKSYLEYHKDYRHYSQNTPFWRCRDLHIGFSKDDLRLLLQSGSISIDSVNYPERLHITADGITAG